MTTTLERIAPFKNEAIKNFTDPADAAAMRAALARVKARFGERYPLVIDGKRIETEKKIRSINPANPDEVVGLISSASKEQALEAIEAATAAFESWKRFRCRSEPTTSSKPPSCCASAASITMRCSRSKSARGGPKPTAIPPKRSISSSFTRARHCATRSRIPSSRSKASATRWSTFRSASAP